MGRRQIGRTVRRALEHWYAMFARHVLAHPVRLASRLLRFRFVPFTTDRIGHLAVEPDLFIKEGQLGLRPIFREVVLVHPERVANSHLLDYWADELRTVRSPLLNRVLLPFARDARLCYDTRNYVTGYNATSFGSILRDWGQRAPLLSLRPDDRIRGRRQLAKLGMPEDAWFVCVHCREEGFAPGDRQRYRNADVASFSQAMRAITERGGWVVRLGDSSMKPLAAADRVIDYAVSPAKSDWMDVFLCAEARCLLGSCSGLANVAQVFGVPTASANSLPLASALPYGGRALGIPKLLWSEGEGRYLGFREIFESPVADFRHDEEYREADLRIVDNTADEILELGLELLEVADATAAYTDADQRAQQLFHSWIRPEHYGHALPTRIGRSFLRKHAALLD